MTPDQAQFETHGQLVHRDSTKSGPGGVVLDETVRVNSREGVVSRAG